MVALLDQFGRPLQRETLSEPQTAKLATLHQEFANHPSRGLTPGKLATILEQAEQGDLIAQAELGEDMEEKDGHIYAELSKRKRALLGLEWTLLPPRNPTRQEENAAGLAHELLQDLPDLEDVMLDALDAIGHGFACLEIEWHRLGRYWLPKTIEHRPQSWFMLDRATRRQLRLRDNSGDGAELQPFGWIIHRHKAKSGYLGRAGLHRILAWPFLFKNYSIRDLAEFLEIYGLPLRLGTYPPGAGDAEKATLLKAVVNIGHAAAGIIPEGMAIEFKEAAKGASDPFEAMISWCERTQSKAILGGTLTSQADGKTSTNALGNVHNEVRHDLLVADARQLCGTLTSYLVHPLLVLNGMALDGLRRCPRFSFDTREPEDLSLYAEALPKLVGVGMQIPQRWAAEKLRIPEPQENEPVLAAPAPGLPLTPGRAALKASSRPASDQAVLDAALDDLPSAELQAQAEQLLAPVINLLSQVGPEAAMTRLAELFPELDDSGLEDMLSRAIFVAETWGRLNA